LNLACWITSCRFILAPLIFWQLTTHSKAGIIWTLVLLFLSGSTDVIDGWVARARNEISEIGKALDPVADKSVILGTLLGLTWWGLPIWMVLVYLIKETFQVLAGVFLFRKFNQLIPANYWGKSSTLTFFLGFGIFIWSHIAGTIIIGFATLLSIYALFTYYQAFVKLKKV
jgi:cardiolipin synthase (CMP-forming)